MLKQILAVSMAALALVFAVQLSSEHFFREKQQAAAQTMAGTAAILETERQTEAQGKQPVQQVRKPEVYALFGVDTEEGDAGRSDCILLLSMEDGMLRMCSVSRDTLVTLAGDGSETKLGHAYALGGPGEAVATINRSFGLEVEHYVTVNFTQMKELVDLLGGVELDLTQAEWDCLELGKPYLGRKRLDGEETLRYCRIRAIDSDDMRTLRQRKVLGTMVETLARTPRGKMPELAAAGFRLCRTDLALSDLLHLGKELLEHRKDLKTESLSIPGDSVTAWGGVRSDGVWYYVYDLSRAGETVREFFYEA